MSTGLPLPISAQWNRCRGLLLHARTLCPAVWDPPPPPPLVSGVVIPSPPFFSRCQPRLVPGSLSCARVSLRGCCHVGPTCLSHWPRYCGSSQAEQLGTTVQVIAPPLPLRSQITPHLGYKSGPKFLPHSFSTNASFGRPDYQRGRERRRLWESGEIPSAAAVGYLCQDCCHVLAVRSKGVAATRCTWRGVGARWESLRAGTARCEQTGPPLGNPHRAPSKREKGSSSLVTFGFVAGAFDRSSGNQRTAWVGRRRSVWVDHWLSIIACGRRHCGTLLYRIVGRLRFHPCLVNPPLIGSLPLLFSCCHCQIRGSGSPAGRTGVLAAMDACFAAASDLGEEKKHQRRRLFIERLRLDPWMGMPLPLVFWWTVVIRSSYTFSGFNPCRPNLIGRMLWDWGFIESRP
jgi:hypothetical protein